MYVVGLHGKTKGSLRQDARPENIFNTKYHLKNCLSGGLGYSPKLFCASNNPIQSNAIGDDNFHERISERLIIKITSA